MPVEGRKLHIVALIKETLATHRSKEINGNEINMCKYL
jgi:hypothetical protein